MAAQHLPRNLARPSSGYKQLAQAIKKPLIENQPCGQRNNLLNNYGPLALHSERVDIPPLQDLALVLYMFPNGS